MKHVFAACFLLAVSVVLAAAPAWAAPAITVISDGNFGTVTAWPTASGNNYMEMGTNGAISYDITQTGPATGTVMTFQATGYNVGDQLTVTCEQGGSNKFTNSTAGSGDTSLNVTTVRLVRQTGQPPGTGVICNGVTGSNSIVYNYAGVAAQDTFMLDFKVRVRNPKFAGSYSLSQDNTGKWDVRIVRTAPANTQNSSVDMWATFISAAAVSATTDMDFGKVFYAPGALGAADHVDLGTNGTAVYAGKFSAGPGVLSAGSATLTNIQDGVTVEVDCNTPLTLTNGAGASIQVTGVKARRENGVGTYAAIGTICNGIGGAVTTTSTYTAGSNDAFKFGGVLAGSTAVNFTDGAYSTANAGGTDLTVIFTTQ